MIPIEMFITAEKGGVQYCSEGYGRGREGERVQQSARANGDCMRQPPGHLITGAGREEMMRTLLLP